MFATQAIGLPDTPECNVEGNSWAPEPSGTNPEWLEVRFDPPVFAFEITVYETYDLWGFGSVYQVDLIDTEGGAHIIWAGNDYGGCQGEELMVLFDQTDYPVIGATIHTRRDGREQIDAVKLVGMGPAD